MFYVSRIFDFASQPLAWTLLLLVVGQAFIRRKPAIGRGCNVAALLVLVLTGWELPAEALLQRIEARHTAFQGDADLTAYAGVVILGGAMERSRSWEFPGRIALNAAAERLIVPVGLVHRFPHLKLVYTGGEGELGESSLTDAARAKIFFDSLGFAPDRVIYEAKSRTTYENAVLTAELPGVDTKLPWLLLTSAVHMPRSMAVFQKAGWNVTAYPVDFIGSDRPDWFGFNFRTGSDKWYSAIHELIGYAAYWATGRI